MSLPQGARVLVSGQVAWSAPADVEWQTITILEREETTCAFLIVLEGYDLQGDLVRAELEYSGETEWTPIVSTWMRSAAEWVLEMDETEEAA